MLTGFRDLDHAIGGFSPGEIVFVSGETMMGKTSLALNISLHEARRGGASAIFSLAMDKGRVLQRLISAATGVPI